jgi:hypothetical protein
MKEWAKIHLVEAAALKAAAAVTITDDESLEALMSQYPFLENKPCRAILNGFDDNALKKMENLDRAVLHEQEPMTIGIFGKFESYISLKNLPWFIKLLREYSARRDGGIRVFHYGAPEPVFAMGMRDAGIDYEDRGYAQYEVGIENLVKSANVLLAANDVMMGYGTKIFDYIFINKPVLMYAPQGSTLDRFVGGFPNGYSFHDEESLRAALEDLFRDKPEHLAGSMDPYKYGRSHQNQLFEKFIEEVANGTGKENK